MPIRINFPSGNMQHDDAFLSLLSSQRELLNQLNMENNRRRVEMGLPAGFAGPPPSTYPRDPSQIPQMNIRTASPNRSIDEYYRAPAMDYISKRLSMSLGMGYDTGYTNLPPYSYGSDEYAVPKQSKWEDQQTGSSSSYMKRRLSKLDDSYLNESRRLSMIGGFSMLDDGYDLGYAGGAGTKRDKLDDLSEAPGMHMRKKRRLSSLGFLSTSFFEDNLKDPDGALGISRRDSLALGVSRRDSLALMASLVPQVPSHVEEKEVMKPKAEEPAQLEDEEDDENVEQVIVDGDADSDDEDEGEANEAAENVKTKGKQVDAEKSPSATTKHAKSIVYSKDKMPIKRFDAAAIREAIEKFTKSMEMSQKSQQAIHDWDRKMGLKRSHSKTMRQSSRSRKKLKASMKKEITSINNFQTGKTK